MIYEIKGKTKMPENENITNRSQEEKTRKAIEEEIKKKEKAENKDRHLLYAMVLKRAAIAKKEKATLKKITKLERLIREGESIPFFYIFLLCVVVDIADLIPVVGTILNVMLLPLLWYIKIFRRHILKELGVSKITIYVSYALSITDLAPILSILPFNILSNIILWRKVKKKIKELKEEIRKLEKSLAKKKY